MTVKMKEPTTKKVQKLKSKFSRKQAEGAFI